MPKFHEGRPLPYTGSSVINPVYATQPKPVESPFLTTKEAAEYLRTTTHTIYDWVKRGKLHPEPGIKGKLLFTKNALNRFAATRRRR